MARRDLTGDWLQKLSLRRSTMVREPGPNRFLSVAELPAGSRVSPLCRSVRWRCAAARLLVLGSVSVDGVCPTHLQGWPSRHRTMPAISGRQTLPYSCVSMLAPSWACLSVETRVRATACFAAIEKYCTLRGLALSPDHILIPRRAHQLRLEMQVEFSRLAIALLLLHFDPVTIRVLSSTSHDLLYSLIEGVGVFALIL